MTIWGSKQRRRWSFWFSWLIALVEKVTFMPQRSGNGWPQWTSITETSPWGWENTVLPGKSPRVNTEVGVGVPDIFLPHPSTAAPHCGRKLGLQRNLLSCWHLEHLPCVVFLLDGLDLAGTFQLPTTGAVCIVKLAGQGVGPMATEQSFSMCRVNCWLWGLNSLSWASPVLSSTLIMLTSKWLESPSMYNSAL